MEKLKLGVIGLSEGNGHPYSWSAIFNGFDNQHIKACSFPVIPKYLSAQQFPDNFLITEAEVTHIYTQDLTTSEAIARFAKIEHIVVSPEEMLGQVDAVLLARDDTENHPKYATAFLQAGIPIYIDKPLAHTVQNANELINSQKFDNQIYTCSALRYAKEFCLSSEQKQELGKIITIQAYTPKSWQKYAIHIIEPVLCILDFPLLSDFKLTKIKRIHRLSFIAKDEILVSISNLQTAKFPIRIEIIGEKSSLCLDFKDSFNAFKSALQVFINQVRTKQNMIPRAETLQIIHVIEEGLNS